MELLQPQLQLVVNVIAITFLTSLILTHAFRKKDKSEVADVNVQRNPESIESPATVAAVSASAATPASREDIRQFVGNRIDGWTALSGSRGGTRMGSFAK